MNISTKPVAEITKATGTMAEDEYHLFKKFPPEVRNSIWAAALPEANVIKLFLDTPDDSIRSRCLLEISTGSVPEIFAHVKLKAEYKVPSILHVSQEARSVAKRNLKALLAHEFGDDKPVYFQPHLDTLHIKGEMTVSYLCNGADFIIFQDRSTRAPLVPGIRTILVECYRPGMWNAGAAQLNPKHVLEGLGKPKYVAIQRHSSGKVGSKLFGAQWNFDRFVDGMMRGWWWDADNYGSDDYEMPEVLLLTTLQLQKKLQLIDHPPRPKKARAAKKPRS